MRHGTNVWLYYPKLRCVFCRIEFTWPWSIPESKRPLTCTLQPHNTREGEMIEPAFVVSGMSTETELVPLAQQHGWTVQDQRAVCPDCLAVLKEIVGSLPAKPEKPILSGMSPTEAFAEGQKIRSEISDRAESPRGDLPEE